MFDFLSLSFVGFYEYLYSLTHDYGLALIVFVFLLRTSLLPLNYLVFLEENKLKKIKPQIEEIIKGTDFKKNPQASLEKINEIYKKENFNPILNFFIQFLSFPILISVFFALRKILETKNNLYFLNILDLSKINYVLIFFTLFFQFLLFFVFNKEKKQKEQLIIFFLIALVILNFPSLFTFYWFLNLIFMVLERKLFEIYYVKFRVISIKKNDS